MARSKNCLKCDYCHPLAGACGSKKLWRTHWSCDFYIEEGHMEDKGPDPDNCLLFKKKKRGKRKPELKY